MADRVQRMLPTERRPYPLDTLFSILIMPNASNVTALLFGVCLAALSGGTALGSSHAFYGPVGGALSAEITSFKEAKYRSVIEQQYDFSCGSAALATLLNYHYGIAITEEDAFEAMFEAGDEEKIRAKGFSLLDMKNYLASRGLRSDGYRMPMEKLAQLGVPAIVLINTGGYKHFVVVKGLEGGTVLVGDPARGLKEVPVEDFEAMSQGIVFLIKDMAREARASFNKQADWAVRQEAPLGAADNQIGISNFSLMLPRPGDF